MRRNATVGVAFLLSLGGSAVLAQDNQAPESQVTGPQVTQPQASPPQGDQQQTQSGDPVADMIGTWELSNADHDKICKLNFRKDTVPNGYKLDVDKSCPN